LLVALQDVRKFLPLIKTQVYCCDKSIPCRFGRSQFPSKVAHGLKKAAFGRFFFHFFKPILKFIEKKSKKNIENTVEKSSKKEISKRP
jgi:hypothetical protein